MPDYAVLVLRASDGEALAEVPANSLTYSGVMTGTGTCEFTLPALDPKVLDLTLLRPGHGREVAVIRDGRCVWNGPLIKRTRTASPDVQFVAADPGWYFVKRVTEGARNYGRPVLDAVRNLVEMATGLPANATSKPAQAALYRLTMDGVGGPTKRWSIASTDRTPILDVIGDLADEDVAGFDWRWRYDYNPVGMLVSRVWEFAHPTIGVDRSNDVILQPPHLLDYTEDEDLTRAANRVHVLGAGTGTGRRRAVSVNTSNLNGSGVLWEETVDRTNVANQSTLNGMANAYRRTLAPPVRVMGSTHTPAAQGGLAYGSALLGDTVQLLLPGLSLRRRVVAQTVTVTDTGGETIAWTMSDPADEVVT